ncbi:hypothetical protein BD309DRAFT_392127 [Dichomitus squalens]|uniref:Uncharacterized protein n=1 Tax=Dichomitus squalens TaxID=114155 RepID=A0A4Q9QFR0_9APHY|nr:hypothetical protein BD309DRAFT_392127 [Dichomitus squalens]TBU66071.1 hypothetical protein BD310DRAFT_912697 [Dichomitus squalens]
MSYLCLGAFPSPTHSPGAKLMEKVHPDLDQSPSIGLCYEVDSDIEIRAHTLKNINIHSAKRPLKMYVMHWFDTNHSDNTKPFCSTLLNSVDPRQRAMWTLPASSGSDSHRKCSRNSLERQSRSAERSLLFPPKDKL